MITIKQVEALHQVAVSRSIAAAARKLCTTESAVSKRLQELEQSLNVPLFDRGGRSLALTDTGAAILSVAVELLARRDAMLDIAHSPAFEGRTFRFGMTEFIAANWLTALLEGIRAQYGRVALEPRIGLTDDLLREQAQGELDVVIVPKSAQCAGRVVSPLFISRNVWVCGRTLPYGPGPLRPEDLADASLILQPSSSTLDTTVRQWFAENNAPMPKLISCNSLAGVKSLAVAGFGIVPLPHAYCQDELKAGVLRELVVLPPLPARVYCTVRMPGPAAGLAAGMCQVVGRVLGRESVND
ncbi:LysR family transcriptional regulator [Bordetella sp. BOR01]|uniref:LysR family transcriptional regulator n=1 Tax=Bordetella sp. BOR01 TaxID=2854779 RepID=UPI001C453CB2|nr:LysR family transcriptional regulator [Bordetella sp. BOR01]